ncbi:hypothetical protein SAMN04487965_2966 [Microbulbifer donghaiensis]|uniref:Uncharacterized protein n=1 Tax=Microbulbifer donghaiensis TaxID=494016 RepID=A0A1M5FLT4_9GAMM|nr:hypothetical protein [Microbulbifer donghaiensis]SHF92455.1 hypothetical protein SAMN04487965_2966 [Microbulbifer donghaiensis]
MNNAPATVSYSGLKPYGQSSNGRTLLVNAQQQQLLDGFRQLSNVPSSQGYHAQSITKAIDGLRGCTAPVNSFMKNGNPNRRCIVFSGFEIEYETSSYYGGPQTDVVIVDIRLTGEQAKGERRAALWQVNVNKNGRWETQDQPDSTLEGNPRVPGNEDHPIKVGINGHSDGLEHAAGMLPDHIARGEQRVQGKLKKTGYQLFYVPQSGSTLKAGWSFLRDLGRPASPADLEAARILSHHMKEAHDQGLYVEWTSHRGGSKVLTQAMKLLAQKQVNLGGKQRIFLSDHTSSHFAADVARRAIGMDTRDSKWYNARKGVAQLIGGHSLGAASLACSVNELVYHTKREETAGKIVKSGVSVGTVAYGVYESAPKIAKLVADFGINPAYAGAVLSAIGKLTVLGVVAASVPSLNEEYSKGAMDSIEKLANKASNRLWPVKK